MFLTLNSFPCFETSSIMSFTLLTSIMIKFAWPYDSFSVILTTLNHCLPSNTLLTFTLSSLLCLCLLTHILHALPQQHYLEVLASIYFYFPLQNCYLHGLQPLCTRSSFFGVRPSREVKKAVCIWNPRRKDTVTLAHICSTGHEARKQLLRLTWEKVPWVQLVTDSQKLIRGRESDL